MSKSLEMDQNLNEKWDIYSQMHSWEDVNFLPMTD